METKSSGTNWSSPKPAAGVRSSFFWYALVFIILVVILIVALRHKGKNPAAPQAGHNSATTVTSQLPAGYKTLNPPKGQYPLGFPANVVLTAGSAVMLRAEQTTVGSGQHQDVVEVQVPEAPAQAAAKYQSAMPGLGWKQTGSLSQNGIQTLEYSQNGYQLIVNILAKGSGSQVGLTYIY